MEEELQTEGVMDIQRKRAGGGRGTQGETERERERRETLIHTD